MNLKYKPISNLSALSGSVSGMTEYLLKPYLYILEP